ncbi:MAG: DUF4143 domain-containing protein [Candidatus Rokubacteria bacterium]|nr:DUF4143 domain-containing protein [Candidatus Rokubacteria bacterium]
MSKSSTPYIRPHAAVLARRLKEPRRFIQVVAGARQVGTTTLVQQVCGDIGLPVHFVSADEPTLRGAEWIAQQWDAARLVAGYTFAEARADHEFWGRMTESAVGAHLANAAAAGVGELFYWRERNREVDFVVRAGRRVTAIEVTTGRKRETLAGIDAFSAAFRPHRKLLVGRDGIAVEEFLMRDVAHWAGK